MNEALNLENTSHASIGLSGHLHQKGYKVKLPDIYEQYFLYLEHTREISRSQISDVKRVLASLYGYLENHKLSLAALKIEHLDAFMGEFKVAKTTLRIYRYRVRGFLKYLYAERKIIKKDLASLLVGAPLFAQKKPPKFLRPQDLQKLFSSLKLATSVDIRTYAMIHLAYALGLRPIEISRITLDHISFTRGELSIRERKTKNPTILPLPKQTIKALAAYVFKARPKTELRDLFLTHSRPHLPLRSGTVICAISKLAIPVPCPCP